MPVRAPRRPCSASTSPTPVSTSSTARSSTTTLPHCKSRVTYKGALQGETARTVWVGDVLIRAEAEGTDTYELNRNLVLTDGARADSVPNLEIETGEIKGAGHASATGRFDDLQLFYLQARGIPEDEAKRLVVRGFFVDVIREIPLADLRDEVTAAIEEELAATEYAAPDSRFQPAGRPPRPAGRPHGHPARTQHARQHASQYANKEN